MRFFLVIAIWIVIVGGLTGYINKRDARRMEVQASIAPNIEAIGNFSIELTPTFSVEKDPFALTTSDAAASSVEVRLNGTPLILDSSDLKRGVTLRSEGVNGMLAGHNEIYVNASPPVSEDTLEHGIRVKLIQDRAVVADQTVWAEKGALVSGTVSFMYQEGEEESHDH